MLDISDIRFRYINIWKKSEYFNSVNIPLGGSGGAAKCFSQPQTPSEERRSIVPGGHTDNLIKSTVSPDKCRAVSNTMFPQTPSWPGGCRPPRRWTPRTRGRRPRPGWATATRSAASRRCPPPWPRTSPRCPPASRPRTPWGPAAAARQVRHKHECKLLPALRMD